MKYMKLGSKPDVFQTDGNNIRFVATELATDIIVTVGDVKFFLHKFPLLSKSARLQKLVNDETSDEFDLSDIPGGPSSFEICAKFCYGMIVTLNAYNVVAARCAAEYLEMHENIEKGNLIYKIDVFLSSSILRTWKDSIIVLQATRNLAPWVDDLKIVSRCVESIANKASIHPNEVEWSYTYNRKKLVSENGNEMGWNGVRKQVSVPKDWWVEDLCELEMDLYKRVLAAIKSKGKTSNEVIGEAVKAYAYRKLSNVLEASIGNSVDLGRSKSMLETIVWLLPSEKGSVSCGFLLKLLRAACLLGSSESCQTGLVKRVGRELENASVSDLLIPNKNNNNDDDDDDDDTTMHNVDMVVNIVTEFLSQQNNSSNENKNNSINGEIVELADADLNPNMTINNAKIAQVAKLIDGYLAEAAKDSNLPLVKFVGLAEMISIESRPVHDGLYRAIDMYLKEHPTLTKSEKKRLCGLMDCKKLSHDACMHAVQNERLPLRVVVQVLFFEQLRSSSSSGTPNNAPDLPAGVRSLLPRENGNSYGSSRSAATTYTEDDTNGAPITDMNSFRSLRGANKSGGSERSSGSSERNHNGNSNGVVKVSGYDQERKSGSSKGMFMPKKILSKIWSGKMNSGENSSSDTSESPGSVNPEETKSTPSRVTRHSVS